MSNGSMRPLSIGICSKLGPHELLFQSSVHIGRRSVERRLEVQAADAEAAVADHEHDLLARPRELRADRHADAVADRRERPRVDDLAREARANHCVSHPDSVKLSMMIVASRSSTSSRSRTRRSGWIGRASCVSRSPARGALVELRCARRGYLGEPRAVRAPGAVESRSSPASWRAGEARASDRRRRGPRAGTCSPMRVGVGVDLDVGRVGAPCRRLAEVLAAPEAEADRQDHVGATGERLLPCAADGERMVLGHGALAGAARVDGDAGELGERAQLGGGVGPEDAVAGHDQRPLGARAASSVRSIAAGIARGAQLVGGYTLAPRRCCATSSCW